MIDHVDVFLVFISKMENPLFVCYNEKGKIIDVKTIPSKSDKESLAKILLEIVEIPNFKYLTIRDLK